jgi:hypothetical protein
LSVRSDSWALLFPCRTPYLGPDHRLLPLSAIVAIPLILADTASRTLLAPSEVPVGVITAFWGPLFPIPNKMKRAVFLKEKRRKNQITKPNLKTKNYFYLGFSWFLYLDFVYLV